MEKNMEVGMLMAGAPILRLLIAHSMSLVDMTIVSPV